MVQQAEREAAVPVVAERVRDLRSEVADPQVVEKAKRRRFSASYKLKILEEVDRNPHRSGAILRREGLYSSHLSAWRKQREEGALKALDKKRGPKGKSAEQVQIEKLAREKARLERELFKANAIIDAQKKLAEILGVDLPKITDPDGDKSE
jgi:transposase-like protein